MKKLIKKITALGMSIIMVLGAAVIVYAYTTGFDGYSGSIYYAGNLGLTYDNASAELLAQAPVSNEDVYTELDGFAKIDISAGGGMVLLRDEGWNSSYDAKIVSGLRNAECKYYVDYDLVERKNLTIW